MSEAFVKEDVAEKRTKTKLIEEAEKLMYKMSISAGEAVMAPNASPGTLGTRMKVQTNAFGMGVESQKSYWRYDIFIHADIGDGKQLIFTRKGREDFYVLDRQRKCVAVMKAVFAKYADFFKNDLWSLWYDGQSILYTGVNLFDGKTLKFQSLIVKGSECDIGDLRDFETIIVDIKPVDKDFCLSLSRETMLNKTANSDLSMNDRSIAQFIEMAVNQHAIMNPDSHVTFENGKTFLAKPWEEGFTEIDCPSVGDAKRLLVGIQKSLRFIEGPRGRGVNNPALIVDAKKAAFHENIMLIEKAHILTKEDFKRPVSERSLEKMNSGMKGLCFLTKHTGQDKNHRIIGIAKHTARTASFECQSPSGPIKKTVEEYYKQKYNIILKYPDAPLAIVKERGQTNWYPLELGKIQPLQRVTIPQQTPEQSYLTTRNCAVPPAKRQVDVMKGARALNILDPENAYITNAGLKVYPKPIQVNGRVLPPPRISYQSGSSVPVEYGKWRAPRGHLRVPAKCSMWAMYAVVDTSKKEQFDKKILTNFALSFYKDCCSRGMQLPHPTELKVVGEQDVYEVMRTAANHNCQLCFFITSDSITTLHRNLKLWERELQMVTQDMKMSNVFKIVSENKMLTLENIVMKTNVKLGGLNYEIKVERIAQSQKSERWIHPGRLIIGIGVSHPPPSSIIDIAKGGKAAPTVVGYSANFKSSPFDFVGDYLFQTTRREETLTTMPEVVKVVLSRYMENHKNRPPSELIIYRSGISEGSFSTVLMHEMPFVRRALTEAGATSVKVTFIVAQKEHNVRLMLDKINPNDKPTGQNIRSGCVVDTELTHPSFKEFYLNSHITLQGTARTPRYTVLVDDSVMSMDELEGMTYTLSFGHQIVTLATSLPTPLYVANRYAERGRNIFIAHSASAAETSSSDSSSTHDCARLTATLSYNGTRLTNFRVNA